MVKNWYVLTHDSKYHQSLIKGIEALGVEVYSPVRISSCKRKDRPSYTQYEVILFPGYLLLYFDPFTVHTTQISALNGAYGFVRFGRQQPCVVRKCVVEKLKQMLDQRQHSLESHLSNLGDSSSDLERSLNFIIEMHSPAARASGFQALIKQDDLITRLKHDPDAMVHALCQALKSPTNFQSV